MDVMDLRRGLLMGMTWDKLPAYLKHVSFVPTENATSHQFQIGDGAVNIVLVSNVPIYNLEVATITSGVFITNTSGGVTTSSRMGYRNTNGSSGSYSPNSGGQSWSYSDGILSISSNVYFSKGYQYDLFYF